MFIHGSTKSLGSISNKVASQTDSDANFIGCTSACGSRDVVEDYILLSAFCEATMCSSDDNPKGSIFKRFGCGAGDPSKFSPACRACMDKRAELGTEDLLVPNKHTTKCRKTSVKSVACTQQCSDNINTVRTSWRNDLGFLFEFSNFISKEIRWCISRHVYLSNGVWSLF